MTVAIRIYRQNDLWQMTAISGGTCVYSAHNYVDLRVMLRLAIRFLAERHDPEEIAFAWPAGTFGEDA